MPTVLHAETDSKLRDVSRSFLSSQGWQVDAAVDALECLAKLRRSVPDLLILDLELPWGGGDGVLGLLREQPQLRPNRVVLTSAVASAHVLDKLASFHQQRPYVQALTKPFPLSALLGDRAFDGAELPKKLAKDSRRRAVLVVDDEPAIRDVLQTHLQHEGFQVWTAASGEEALDLCCDHADEIAVILLDVRMPGLDGPQTLDGIRALDVDVPVCFMTGSPGDYEPCDLLRQGGASSFRKTVNLG